MPDTIRTLTVGALAEAVCAELRSRARRRRPLPILAPPDLEDLAPLGGRRAGKSRADVAHLGHVLGVDLVVTDEEAEG